MEAWKERIAEDIQIVTLVPWHFETLVYLTGLLTSRMNSRGQPVIKWCGAQLSNNNSLHLCHIHMNYFSIILSICSILLLR